MISGRTFKLLYLFNGFILTNDPYVQNLVVVNIESEDLRISWQIPFLRKVLVNYTSEMALVLLKFEILWSGGPHIENSPARSRAVPKPFQLEDEMETWVVRIKSCRAFADQARHAKHHRQDSIPLQITPKSGPARR